MRDDPQGRNLCQTPRLVDGTSAPDLAGDEWWLTARLAQRHAQARHGLTGQVGQVGLTDQTDQTGQIGLTGQTGLAGGPAGAVVPDRVSVPVAVRVFAPAAILAGAMAFAAALSTVDADAWLRSYTRSLFLFGNPANLAARYPPALVAAGGQAAWLGVYDARRAEHVRRLLRPVCGVLPADPGRLDTVVGPDARPGWLLQVAVRDLDLPRYLVHLHHTAAEAVLTGVMPAGATVALRHVPDLDPAAARLGGCGYARVHPLPPPADRPALRLYTVLTRL